MEHFATLVIVDDLARLVGGRLRAARRERGLSVGALAEAAGVGKGSLSEIENGIRNPTLSTLYSLAGTLGVPLATLIADRPGARVTAAGVEARLLDVSHDCGQVVEVYRLRIEPGVHYRSVPHGPGVVEHMLVTAGRARVGRLAEETEIGTGQAAQWVSDVVHAYTALGADPVESVLIIRSPEATAPIVDPAGRCAVRGGAVPADAARTQACRDHGAATVGRQYQAEGASGPGHHVPGGPPRVDLLGGVSRAHPLRVLGEEDLTQTAGPRCT